MLIRKSCRRAGTLMAGLLLTSLVAPGSVWGQGPGGGCCRGMRGDPASPKLGRGMRADDHRADMELFHFLLDNRDRVRREVSALPNGVRTVTESEDPEIAKSIRAHVGSMYLRVKENRPIHARDPLFAELFRHGDKIKMALRDTDKGIEVEETSDDPEVVKLIQAHAETVSRFIRNGYSEVRKDHAIPQ